MAKIINLNLPATSTEFDDSAAAHVEFDAVTRLILRCGDQVRMVARNEDPFVIGRNGRGHFRVGSKYASRVHAHIEDRDTGLFLVDTSTHGTYVRSQLWGAFHLKKTDMLLEGEGVISLGIQINYNDPSLIRYTTE